MKKNNKFLFSLLALTLFAAIGVNSVAAFGGIWRGNLDPEQIIERQTQMFVQKAELFDISVEEVKEYWSQGKNMQEMAEELGITEDVLQQKMQAMRQENMKTRMQVLVDNGVVTQEQADSHVQAMGNREIGRRLGLKKPCRLNE